MQFGLYVLKMLRVNSDHALVSVDANRLLHLLVLSHTLLKTVFSADIVNINFSSEIFIRRINFVHLFRK
jgi:hypothetical protein